VTEHKKPDYSARLILSRQEAGSIHPVCAGCTEQLICKESMDIFSPF